MENSIVLWNEEIGYIRVDAAEGYNRVSEDTIMIEFLNYDGFEIFEHDETDNLFVKLTKSYQDQFHTVEELIQYLIDYEWIPDVEYKY